MVDPVVDLQRTLAELRRLAEDLAQNAPGPVLVLPAIDPARRRYRLHELEYADGEEFVESIHRAIVKRAPSPAELLSCLDRYYRGANKVELIGELRGSAEARAIAVTITGLGMRYRLWRLARLRLLGGLIRRVACLFEIHRFFEEQKRFAQSQALRLGERDLRLQIGIDELRRKCADLAAQVAALDARERKGRGVE